MNIWKNELNFKLKNNPQRLHYLIWLSKGKSLLLSLTIPWLDRGERQGSQRISFLNQDQVFKFLCCTPSLLCTGRSIICSVLQDGTETFGLLRFVFSSLLRRKTKTSWMDVIQGERHLEQKECLCLGAEHQGVRNWSEYIVRNCGFHGGGWEGGVRCRWENIA